MKTIKYFTIDNKTYIIYGYRLIIGNEAFRINRGNSHNICKDCNAGSYCDIMRNKHVAIIDSNKGFIRYLCNLVLGINVNVNFKRDKLGLIFSRYLIKEVVKAGIELKLRYD